MEKTRYDKILVAYDGSEIAAQVLPHAASLALVYHAEILLLQVLDPVEYESAVMNTPTLGVFATAAFDDFALETVKEKKLRAKHHMKIVKRDLEHMGVPRVLCLVEEGSPQDVIVETAWDEACTLIVMSTHARTGFGRVFPGSITDAVIRHATCPVLVIHTTKYND